MSDAVRSPPFEIPTTGIADENDRFWERAAGVETPAATPAHPAAVGTEAPVGCVVLGPISVGKTSWLMAIERACSLPAPGEPDLLFVPERETALLIQKAVRVMINPGERTDSTRAAASYRFHIRAEAGPRSLRFEDPVTMMLSDGPGGALFPAELGDRVLPHDYDRWREQMVDHARRAKAIVFCVSSIEPHSDRWQEHLSVLIAEMKQHRDAHATTSSDREGQPSAARFAAAPMTLQAERVLVLLTKMDQLCDRILDAVESASSETEARGAAEDGGGGRGDVAVDRSPAVLQSLRSLSAARLATAIDPIQQARETLGVHVLNQIRYALKPGAQLAVGVCSSGGFDPRTGDPYWTPDGKPRTLSAETNDEVLRRWVPFGVRDAVFFIATGKARGTVRLVRRHNLLLDPKALPVEIARVAHVVGPRPPVATAGLGEEGDGGST